MCIIYICMYDVCIYIYTYAYVYIMYIYIYACVHVMFVICLTCAVILIALFVLFCHFPFDTGCLQQWQHMKKRNNKNITKTIENIANYKYLTSLSLLLFFGGGSLITHPIIVEVFNLSSSESSQSSEAARRSIDPAGEMLPRNGGLSWCTSVKCGE